MKHGNTLLIAALGLLTLAARGASGQSAPALTTLHSFGVLADDGNPDGEGPKGHLLRGQDGNFYGVTQEGGVGENGVVFKITPTGTESILHGFGDFEPSSNDKNTEGAGPAATLVQDENGNFYGTTLFGGRHGVGTVFRLTGTAVTNLHNFNKPLITGFTFKGSEDLNGLVRGSDGAYYGTAGAGGAASHGTAFRITSDGTLTTLHDFSAVAKDTGANGDGSSPDAALIVGRDGNFYGTTFAGGEGGQGTVFRLTSTGTLTTLHSFGSLSNGTSGTNQDGGAPIGLVQADDGNFYGTTYQGGPGGNGTIFRLTPTGTLTVLHGFAATDASGFNADGAAPNGTLIQGSDGNFYGATSAGGAAGTGTLFQMTPTGTLTSLYHFGTLDELRDNAAGADPNGVIQGPDGDFYGTTDAGGVQGLGTVFKLTVALAQPSPVLTSADSFTAGAGQAFAFQITATDHPTQYTASGLPAGLSVNAATGLISGTTSTEGIYNVALSAANGARVGTGTLVLTVAPSVTLAATVPTVEAGSSEIGEFTLQLSTAQDHDVVVSFTIGGSAVNGTDYAALKTTKTIKAGKTSKPIKIVPQGDAGSKRTVVLTLQSGEGYAVGTPGKVKVKILGQ